MGTIEDLSADASLATIANLDVGSCGGSSTAEQTALFSHRNNAGTDDLVVYVVASLQGGAGNFVGCATHPANMPGCAIDQTNARWLTAHELGHVLGLGHVNDSNRLMNPNIGWTNVPPDVIDSEYTTMRNSNLTP